jgi:hypothetical protein
MNAATVPGANPDAPADDTADQNAD